MAIRIGLIGAGHVGRAYLENLAEIPEAEIAAVCDTDRARAESAAQPFGASVHINFRAMMEAEQLDAIFVSVPPFARGELVVLAARAGIHLFVEGPVALSIQQARQIEEEIRKAGVLTSVGYLWRYLSGVDRVRELLEGKKIALVRGCRFGPAPAPGWRCKHESSGGYFLQEATQLIDLARHMAGDIIGVCAMDFQGIAAARVADYDIEDAMMTLLRFRNGALGEIVSADIAPRAETALSIFADRFEVRITAESVEIREPGQEFRLNHAGFALRTAQEMFLEAVRTGNSKPIRTDYADAVRTLEAALAAVESARTGKLINL